MTEPTSSAVHQRWRGAFTTAETGFTAVPDILIRSQGQPGISSTEMVMLLNIFLHWWRGFNLGGLINVLQSRVKALHGVRTDRASAGGQQ